jgi:hypothetical protein
MRRLNDEITTLSNEPSKRPPTPSSSIIDICDRYISRYLRKQTNANAKLMMLFGNLDAHDLKPSALTKMAVMQMEKWHLFG